MSPLPWQAKIIGKLVLARIPLSYRHWKRVGIFKHGKMQDPSYALTIFRKHYDRVEFPRKGKGYVALELGPGDSLYSALIARAYAASSIHLVDTGHFASGDIGTYKALFKRLAAEGLFSGNVSGASSVDEMLSVCNATYHTEGLNSLRQIPSKSVDFIWSQAVLEHIRQTEFLDTMTELRRILRDDGVCSHRIDLKDHLGGGLESLRFSPRVWESKLFSASGFYTNRLRYEDLMSLFHQAGFSIKCVHKDCWDKLPIRRDKLWDGFAKMSNDNLLVSGVDIVLRPRLFTDK